VHECCGPGDESTAHVYWRTIMSWSIDRVTHSSRIQHSYTMHHTIRHNSHMQPLIHHAPYHTPYIRYHHTVPLAPANDCDQWGWHPVIMLRKVPKNETHLPHTKCAFDCTDSHLHGARCKPTKECRLPSASVYKKHTESMYQKVANPSKRCDADMKSAHMLRISCCVIYAAYLICCVCA
jgi:hypothetical protein